MVTNGVKPPVKSRRKWLGNELLEWAVNRADSAGDPIKTYENDRTTLEGVIESAKGTGDKEQRELTTRKARAELHYVGVFLNAAKEIQRAAQKEIGKIQSEFFVEKIDVGDLDENGQIVVRAVLRQDIPNDYRLHWTVGDYEPVPDPPQGIIAHIDTRGLPEGDLTVRAILEKGAYPL